MPGTDFVNHPHGRGIKTNWLLPPDPRLMGRKKMKNPVVLEKTSR
jgi:hypothetical protein